MGSIATEGVPRLRKLYYDAMEDGRLACSAMGFVPMSDDVAIQEAKGSLSRTQRIDPLKQNIAEMSFALANMFTTTHTPPGIPSDLRQAIVASTNDMITAAVVASISTLVERGDLFVSQELHSDA